jgi:O-antigen/teichoic acid export membrane protein
LNAPRSRLRFFHLFGSAVVDQAVLSAASFLVGLMLIRWTADHQYGYYILVANSLLLISGLQNAFFGPPLADRIARLDPAGRSALVGGLYREQRRLLAALLCLGIAVWSVLWLTGVVDHVTGPLVLAALVAVAAAMSREYFRMVLLSHRRPQDVLKADLFYVAMLVGGAFLATRTASPAAAAVLALALAATVGGGLMARALKRHEPWDIEGAPGILREITPLGLWATAGAAIHWSFSQGYSYLVAGTLDVDAVAAIAACRLLMMPINLLSTGVGSLMMPLASKWLHSEGTAVVFRRLLLAATGLATIAAIYFGVMWALRDWIFTVLLKKHFAQRDELLLLWGLIFMVMVFRDQLIYLLVSRQRFHRLTMLTFASAVMSLTVSYLAMQHWGLVGALIGVLVGEVVNVTGIVLLSLHETGRATLGTPEPERA